MVLTFTLWLGQKNFKSSETNQWSKLINRKLLQVCYCSCNESRTNQPFYINSIFFTLLKMSPQNFYETSIDTMKLKKNYPKIRYYKTTKCHVCILHVCIHVFILPPRFWPELRYFHFMPALQLRCELGNDFVWKRFTVQSLLWSPKYVIHNKSRARHHCS